MARSTVLPTATYPAGQRTIGPANIANGLTEITVEIQRCTSVEPTIWPNETTTLTTIWEFSVDAGATWFHWITTEDSGGISVSPKTGLEVPLLTIGGPIPPGTQRRLRATLTISEPLRTQVVIDVV